MITKTTEKQLAEEWEAVVAAEPGHVFLDRIEDGLRFVILRGPCALCAYVGVPNDHPLAGHSYDDLPVDCHGGLTFAGKGERIGLSKDRFWYGWDYGHCADQCIYQGLPSDIGGHKWVPSEVDSESWRPLHNFRSLLKLSEAILRQRLDK